VRVCVCVRVCEREKEIVCVYVCSKEREFVFVHVCVCVYVRERDKKESVSVCQRRACEPEVRVLNNDEKVEEKFLQKKVFSCSFDIDFSFDKFKKFSFKKNKFKRNK